MNNPLAPTHEDSGIRFNIEIKTDLIVFGMMAAHWSSEGGSFGACMRGWGSDLRTGGITVGTDYYTCGRVTSGKAPPQIREEVVRKFGPDRFGMLLTCHVNQKNGGTEQRMRWMPMEAFTRAKLVVEGVEG